MANVIEYTYNRVRTGLYMLCGAVVIPLLACILFIREVISTTGFVVITGCGMGGLFLLNEQVERRTRKVTEVASGKLLKQPGEDCAPRRPRVPGRRRLSNYAARLVHHCVAVGISPHSVQDEGGLGCGWARRSPRISCCPA